MSLKITHAAMGWDGSIVCGYSDNKIHTWKTDRLFNREYYKNHSDKYEWPIDPKSGEKLPIRLPESKKKQYWRNLFLISCN